MSSPLPTINLSVRFLPNPTHRHVDNLVAASEPVIEGWFASSLPNLSYLLQDWRYCAQEHWFLQAGHSMSNSYPMRSGLSYPHTPEQSSSGENWMTRWSNRQPQSQGVLTEPDLKKWSAILLFTKIARLYAIDPTSFLPQAPVNIPKHRI